MKFSVFTVMAPDTTPDKILPYLKEFGYEGVEWRFKATPKELKHEKPSFWGNNLCTISPDYSDQELSNLSNLTKEYGMEVASVTPYLNCGDLNATENVLRVAQKLGASTIRIGVPRYNRSQNYHDLYNEAVKYVSEVEQMCKQYQIKGLVETHHETITPSASLAHRLVSHFNPEHIGVLYDPGNMVHEGYENHRMGLELLGPYLAHVHVKNARWVVKEIESDGTEVWQPEWSIIEKGVVNWKQVLKDLNSVGYDGYIGMEDFSQGFSTEMSLRHNIDTIKRLLLEIQDSSLYK